MKFSTLVKLMVAAVFGWIMLSCAGICTSAWDDAKTSSVTTSTNKTKPEPELEGIELNAVAVMGTLTVTIKNADNFDWFNVRLRIPGALLLGGYTFHAGTIKAGEGVEVGLANFVDSSGNRFQPLQKAAQTLFLRAYNKDGLH